MFQLHDEFVAAQSPTGEDRVQNDEIGQSIRGLLAEESPPTWERAYRIERLLVFIRPRSKLLIEADRRVSEAEGLRLPSAAKYRAQLNTIDADEKSAIAAADDAARARANAPQGSDIAQLDAVAAQARSRADAVKMQSDNQRRAVLSAVLDDLQWFYQQRILKRKALWDSARNLVAFGVVTMLIVAVPFLAFVFGKLTGKTTFANLILNFPNYGLFTAMSFGLLGAFFSRLISLQFTSEMTVEDAQNRYGLASLFIRAAVGMCGALVVYFLLGTNLLGTTVKPDYAKLGFSLTPVVTMLSSDSFEVLVPSADWCLLIMWSFLAGFSERLVPESLARAEGQISGTQKQP
jgi:uncharacterized membrane protein YeaQ/YmgE (transglycosylase-associated protein family)